MNYPELIWRLIEIVLQKEKDSSQEIDEVKDNTLNAEKQDETEQVDGLVQHYHFAVPIFFV